MRRSPLWRTETRGGPDDRKAWEDARSCLCGTRAARGRPQPRRSDHTSERTRLALARDEVAGLVPDRADRGLVGPRTLRPSVSVWRGLGSPHELLP